MNFHDQTNAPLDAQIQFSHTTDFVNWSAPQNLPLTATNGTTYDHSADPVFLEYGNVYPYIGWVFCAGTLYSGLPQHNRNSTIGVWHSTDGGVTWSAPDAVDAPPQAVGCDGDIASHSCIFDDKPAITMSQARAILQPAPAATQLTAATTGKGRARSLRTSGL